jgi:hypothetical protein
MATNDETLEACPTDVARVSAPNRDIIDAP